MTDTPLWDVEPVDFDEGSWAQDVRDRLALVLAKRTNVEVGEITGYCAESIRRWRQIDRPRADFLACVARVWQVDLNWLMLGIGAPARLRDHDSPADHLAAEVAALKKEFENIKNQAGRSADDQEHADEPPVVRRARPMSPRAHEHHE